jgi:23S rRNA (uracil1939-C5)-methyltransferase
VLGAYAPRSHDVVDLAGGCRIAEAPLDDVAVTLHQVLERAGVVPYDERTGTGDLRHAVLRVNHQGLVLVTLVTARRDWAAGAAVATALRAARPEVTGVVQNVNPSRGNAIYGPQDHLLDGEATLEESIDGVRLRLSPRAFLQANRDVAALAYRAIAGAARLTGTETVVDAYAGVGGIALTLAPRARAVVGIEEHAAAVDDAAISAARNGATNARFVAGDVAPRLRELVEAALRADVVVLNPPRKGCATAVLEQVLSLAPRTIAYLSCDPATLARDLGWLARHRYLTTSLTPFDMLPHTPHIEVLAVMEFQTGTTPAPPASPPPPVA